MTVPLPQATGLAISCGVLMVLTPPDLRLDEGGFGAPNGSHGAGRSTLTRYLTVAAVDTIMLGRLPTRLGSGGGRRIRRDVAAMVGKRRARERLTAARADRTSSASGRLRLSERRLGRKGMVRDVTFDLHAGGILCIMGLIGSKRTERVHALFGSVQHDPGGDAGTAGCRA